MSTKIDRSEPTWANQLYHASLLTNNELQRHADVSLSNRHRCEDCFCCAALTVIEDRNRRLMKAIWGDKDTE